MYIKTKLAKHENIVNATNHTQFTLQEHCNIFGFGGQDGKF
jgi:hypothetical protein